MSPGRDGRSAGPRSRSRSAIVAVTPLVWRVDWTGGFRCRMAAYLSPAAGSQFPLFPWAAYVLARRGARTVVPAMGHRAARLVCQRRALRARLRAGDAGVRRWRTTHRLVGGGAWDSVPNQVALRMGASLILLSLIAQASQRITRLPHVFGAVAQETLLIYFVHLCIVYGSIWNRGLAQIFGQTLGPGQTVVCVVLLLAAMGGLALYWNWWKHTRPRLARWTVSRWALCWSTVFFNSHTRLPTPNCSQRPTPNEIPASKGQPTSKARQKSH